MIRMVCNECDSTIQYGHYTLTRDDTILEFGDSGDPRHFCNIKCLSNWAGKEAVRAQVAGGR